MIDFIEGFETIGTETGLASASTILDRLTKRVNVTTGADPSDLPFLIDSPLGGFALNLGTSEFSITSVNVAVEETTPGAASYLAGFRLHVPSTPRTWHAFTVDGRLTVGGGFDKAFGVVVEDSTDIVVIRGAALTEVARVNGVLSPGWTHIELKFTVADSGAIEIRVEGTEVLNENPDLNPFLAVGVARISFGGSDGSTSAGDFSAIDDCYIGTNHAWLGPATRVTRLPLSADSDPLQWDAVPPGSHYTTVDDHDDSDYVRADRPAIDMFEHSGLPANGQIYAIKLEAETVAESGNDQNLDLRIDSDGAFTEERFAAANSTYEVKSSIVEMDPKTGSPWTKEAVDAIRAGIEYA